MYSGMGTSLHQTCQINDTSFWPQQMFFTWLLLIVICKNLIVHKGFLTEPALERTGECHWPWECAEKRKCKETTQSIKTTVGSVKRVVLFSVEPAWVFRVSQTEIRVFSLSFQDTYGWFSSLVSRMSSLRQKAAKPPPLANQRSPIVLNLKILANFNLERKFIDLHKQWKVEAPRRKLLENTLYFRSKCEFCCI